MTKTTFWKQEPHTAAKHALLQRYLGGWFPILSRHNGRILFFDGFAGPGRYEGGEPGSPVIALETLLDHGYGPNMKHREFMFLFNEGDRKRCEQLRDVVNELMESRKPWPENISVAVEHGDFETTAEGLLTHLEEQKKKLAPTFAFVDPFGISGLPIELLGRLLNFDKCEVFVFFSFNAINRFATAGNIDERLTELFGTDRFKEVRGLERSERKKLLHDLYQEQLTNVCKFPYVQSFEMITNDGHTGNYLFFGTRNVAGLRVMKEAMWKVDPGGTFQFSDRLAGQDVLFVDEPDTTPLQRSLATHFAGKTVTFPQVEEYVLVHTPYASKHIKTLTLKPMQLSGQISCSNQTRPGTFPDRTLIAFPVI